MKQHQTLLLLIGTATILFSQQVDIRHDGSFYRRVNVTWPKEKFTADEVAKYVQEIIQTVPGDRMQLLRFYTDDRDLLGGQNPDHWPYQEVLKEYRDGLRREPPAAEAIWFKNQGHLRIRDNKGVVTSRSFGRGQDPLVLTIDGTDVRIVLLQFWSPDPLPSGVDENVDVFATTAHPTRDLAFKILMALRVRFGRCDIELSLAKLPWFPGALRYPYFVPFLEPFQPPADGENGSITCRYTGAEPECYPKR